MVSRTGPNSPRIWYCNLSKEQNRPSMRRFSGGKPPKNALTFVTILIGLQAAHAISWTGNPESRVFRTVAVEPPENIIHAVPGTETTMAANKDFLPMDPVVEYCGSIVEVSKSCSCDHHNNKKQICLTNFSRTFEHLRQTVSKKTFSKRVSYFPKKTSPSSTLGGDFGKSHSPDESTDGLDGTDLLLGGGDPHGGPPTTVITIKCDSKSALN